MAASTSTAVPSVVFDDISMLSAVVDRITKDVEDYSSQQLLGIHLNDS